MEAEVACQHTFACTRCGTWLGRKAVVPLPYVPSLSNLPLPETRVSYDIFWGDDYPHYRQDWDGLKFSWEKACNE